MSLGQATVFIGKVLADRSHILLSEMAGARACPHCQDRDQLVAEAGGVEEDMSEMYESTFKETR